MEIIKRTLLGFLLLVFLICHVHAKDLPATNISLEKLEEAVQTLSSPEFQGRRFDSQGNKAAGMWLANQLDEMGMGVPKEGRIQGLGLVQNILGFIPGENDAETIVIGAHYDHLGIRHDKIHYGADDNASGCAAVLEIARAFIDSKIKPKRNVVFAFFDAEETGKVGSKHYLSIVDTPHWVEVHDPPVFMLNFDMVGRMRKNQLQISGFATSPRLSDWVKQAKNATPHLEIKEHKVLALNSDDATFLAYGVPVLGLYSGYHIDYHRPSDSWEKINFKGLLEITTLGFHIANNAAMEEMPLRQFVRPNHPMAKHARIAIGIDERESLK